MLTSAGLIPEQKSSLKVTAEIQLLIVLLAEKFILQDVSEPALEH